MKHPAAQRLKNLATYLQSVSDAIEQGHTKCICEALSQALRLLCNEILIWNKECDHILNKLKNIKKG